MSFIVDAIPFSADLNHDPAIHPALANISKPFRHVPNIISSGNHTIIVRSYV
jgi:hypothetical protein